MNTNYFDKNLITVIYGEKCGTVKIPIMKAFEFERDWNNKISYVVVIRKGLLDFAGWHAYHAYGYGKKNVHYKEFASKNAANKYIEKQINELKK